MEQKFLLILMVLLVPIVSAVRINEVELNPAGTDAGNEWVELYSGRKVDLNEWKLVNNDGGEFLLDSSLSGYLVINFEGQWLDNSDEKIFLYEGDKLIDETEVLEDSKNNDLTWNFCNGWEVIDSTKGEKNKCPEEAEEEPEIDAKVDTKSEELTEEPEIAVKNKSIKKEEPKSIIKLVPKINQENNKVYKSKNWYIQDYAVYAYSAFITFLLILMIIKIKRE